MAVIVRSAAAQLRNSRFPANSRTDFTVIKVQQMVRKQVGYDSIICSPRPRVNQRRGLEAISSMDIGRARTPLRAAVSLNRQIPKHGAQRSARPTIYEIACRFRHKLPLRLKSALGT